MNNIIIGLTALILALTGYVAGVKDTPTPTFGSQVVGSDYNATSTKNFDGTELTNLTVLKNRGGGSLAQVTITGAGAGVLYFWDATTTDINKRQSNQASSTILIGTIPASAAAGTYTFDAQLLRGLIYEEVGTAPTSTIMYR